MVDIHLHTQQGYKNFRAANVRKARQLARREARWYSQFAPGYVVVLDGTVERGVWKWVAEGEIRPGHWGY